MGKAEALRGLAIRRQQTHWPDYAGIADYHGGVYECDHVSPYTKSAHNVDSAVFVLLQDWSSDQFLRQPIDPDARDLGYTPTLPTNKNLKRLLCSHLAMELGEVYATNLFPFIKVGGISRKIPFRDLVRAALEFALPQVNIVRPQLVICLGLDTFNAIREAVDLESIKPMTKAIASPFQVHGATFWGQAHTGARGQNNRNARDRGQVEKDWALMATQLRNASSKPLQPPPAPGE